MRLSVRVQPKASRNRIQIEPSGKIRVHVTAPPVDGAANSAVCALLADAFGLSKSSVQVDKGERGREKQVVLTGITMAAVETRLQALKNSGSTDS